MEDNLERRFWGIMKYCHSYAITLQNYIDTDQLTGPVNQKQFQEEEEENAAFVSVTSRGQTVDSVHHLTHRHLISALQVMASSDEEQKAKDSDDSDSDDSDSDDEKVRKQEEQEAKEKEKAAIAASKKKRDHKKKLNKHGFVEPETLVECLHLFRVMQCQLTLLLSKLMLPKPGKAKKSKKKKKKKGNNKNNKNPDDADLTRLAGTCCLYKKYFTYGFILTQEQCC